MYVSPRVRLAAVAFAGCCFAPSTGLAAKVLVLPYQCMGKGVPTDLAEQATVVITKEIAQGELTVIRADDVADSGDKPAAPKDRRSADAPTGDPAAGAKAEELIARAKEAMEESEFGAAVKHLKAAVKLLEENGDAVADLRLLPEAYLQLGVAHFRDGNEDEGDDMLNKAVHLDPDRKLDPADYPPLFIRVFDRARFNVLRRPRANIEVKAAKGAQVLLDGRNMGKAPIVLKDALPGNHWIRVERPGAEVQVKKISVKGSRTVVVELDGGEGEAPQEGSSVGVLGAIAQNEVTRDHLSQLKAAGARAGADFVMFGGIYKTDTAYNIRTAYVAVADGTMGRLVDIAFDLDMLSAEIEVYKLAEDARAQATSGRLTRVAEGDRIALATQLKSGGAGRTVKPQDETRLTTAVAAPPPPPPPEVPAFDAGAVAASAGGGKKAPLATSGRAPLEGEGGGEASAGEEAGATAAPALVPKDELSGSSSKAGASPLLATAAVGKEDPEEDTDPSTWWIWVLVGVAAAGAAGAGGYLIVSGQSPEEGSLRITW